MSTATVITSVCASRSPSRFTGADANGAVTVINLDRMFAFSVCAPANCGGILVQNQANQNTVPIWVNDFFPTSFGLNPALVNVELPWLCKHEIDLHPGR